MLGALLAVVGLAVLLLGITEAGIAVGVVGFLVMGAGVYYATTRGRKNPPKATDGRKEREPTAQRGFMNNLENKWDERKRDQP